MIRYLTEQNIIDINRHQIETHSPKEQIGVVQQSALGMVVALPKQNVFGQELYPTLFEKSAILYQKLVKKHIFYNANKRTAYHSLRVFLLANGYSLNVATDEVVEFTVKVATDELNLEDITEWTRCNAKLKR